MEKDKEIKKLRSKEICEQQLAIELAIGAIDSIDDLIEQGHEIVCEYACQLLFDNLREKVARRKNLPVRIVQHLLKDRCEEIRLEVIKMNWSSLTNEQQEEFICETERYFSSVKERDSYKFKYTHKTRQMEYIITTLLREALHGRDEPAALRYIKIIGLRDNDLPISNSDVELVPTLKDMPEVFKVYWKDAPTYRRRVDLILAHPDEKERMKEAQKILDKKTHVNALLDWREVVICGEGNLKTTILKLWVADPSEAIRKLIATTTTSVDILEMLSTDSSNIVSQIAYPRYRKFQKRTAYSKAYNGRKKEKLLQEEEAAYAKRKAEREKKRTQ